MTWNTFNKSGTLGSKPTQRGTKTLYRALLCKIEYITKLLVPSYLTSKFLLTYLIQKPIMNNVTKMTPVFCHRDAVGVRLSVN